MNNRDSHSWITLTAAGMDRAMKLEIRNDGSVLSAMIFRAEAGIGMSVRNFYGQQFKATL